MSFDGWYVPGSASSKNKEQVRISKNFISISIFCIKSYFKDKRHARLGYDGDNNQMIIMPTGSEDNLGLALTGDADANFLYLNAKNFIAIEKLYPPEGKRSSKHECVWDEENQWLLVKDVK